MTENLFKFLHSLQINEEKKYQTWKASDAGLGGHSTESSNDYSLHKDNKLTLLNRSSASRFEVDCQIIWVLSKYIFCVRVLARVSP